MTFGPNFAVTGAELTGAHIGQRIRFVQHDDKSRVETIVTGELRAVAHDETSVEITLGNKYERGAYRMFQVRPKQVFYLNPELTRVTDIPTLRTDIK